MEHVFTRYEKVWGPRRRQSFVRCQPDVCQSWLAAPVFSYLHVALALQSKGTEKAGEENTEVGLHGILLAYLGCYVCSNFAQAGGTDLDSGARDREILAPSRVGEYRRGRVFFNRCLLALSFSVSLITASAAQLVSAPQPQTGTIVGTVIDVNNNPVPGAVVRLEGPLPADSATVVTSDRGFFELDHLRPQAPYHVTISAQGFADWNSPEVFLRPGQYLELTGARLKISQAVTTVHATASSEQIATEQVDVELQQRVFGFIPNFFVTYDRQPVPLTPKLKFKIALRASTDPVTFAGAAAVAGMDQAADKFDWPQGAKGYFQRFGASYTNMATDIVIGGAILPSLLHQDPRYFYQGTGTTKSRVIHAITYPFVTRGDNGRRQPNYSNIGGVLAAGAIANAYYPTSNRGAGLVLNSALIDLGAGMANGLLQEFVLHGLTHSSRDRSQTSGN